MEDRQKFPSVGSILGCTETLWGERMESLVWPKMLKSVRALQRRSVSIYALAQKYSPLMQCAEIKLPIEKELAQNLASSFWERSQKNNMLILIFEDLSPSFWAGWRQV